MSNKPSALPASDIIIFGGTGDLSLRKILPALYHRMRDGQLPANSRIIAVDQVGMKTSQYVNQVKQGCLKNINKKDFTKSFWNHFSSRISYVKLKAEDVGSYSVLNELLGKKPQDVRIFYLATPPDIFSIICYNLKVSELITPSSRVVLEKPLGSGLHSFRKINREVLECFNEKQVYRIDHYLGKETVQNLMILRFANNLFGRVWDSDAIDHVQITVAETIGVENRVEYYDKFGTLRDMVQNHLLQLICLVAMEPPSQINADTVRDEKLKILKSLRPLKDKDIKTYTVRGQYGVGKIDNKKVKSYVQDIRKSKSDSETFVALKVEIDSWRWSGIPFYLRTGKRMAKRFSEIVIQFRPAPHHIFPTVEKDPEPNKLIIRLQPDESVKLQMITKVPGPGGYRLKPVHLNLSLADEFDERYPDAYERLLMDVVRGNQTLFMRSDEVEAAWQWTEEILASWKKTKQKNQPYKSGSYGPTQADALIENDGRKWHETTD